MTLTKTLPCLILTILLAANIGCQNSGTETALKFDSPDAVFAHFKSLGEKKDFAGVYSILTPKAQDQIVQQMVAIVPMLKMMADMPGGDDSDNKGKESANKVAAHAKKFGLTEDLLGKITPMAGPDDPAIQAAIKSISDPKGYCAGMMSILSEGQDNDMAKGISEATLTDVKIDGDTATGTLTMNGDSKERIFKKIDGSWRIELID